MSWLRASCSRLAALFRRRRLARDFADLDEEVRTHLDLLAADYERRGLTADAARAAARRDFGGFSQMQDAWRDRRSYPIVENAVRDLRLGARVLRRQPGPALTSIFSLAVAIGGATAVYFVVDAVFYAPLPVTRPYELVIVEPQLKAKRWILPNPIFERLRAAQQSVIGPAAVNDQQFLRVRIDDGPAGFVQASLVSGSYFSVLDIQPALGRLLTDDDDRRDAGECAAVLSHAYWSRQFAADPAVLGRRLRAREIQCVIVGVTPPSFNSHLSGYSPDLWLPLRPLHGPRDLDNYFGAFFSGVIARLKPGVSAERAAAEMTAVYQEIHRDIPRAKNEAPIDPADVRIRLSSGASGLNTLRAEFGRALGVLMALVTIVVVLAAVNVATVTLARGVAREAELTTRRALGASSGRLVAHLAGEGAVIVVAATLFGLGIAAALAPFIASFITLDYQTIAVGVAPSWRLALFVAATAGVLLVLVAAWPAYRLTRSETALVVTTRSFTASRRAHRTLRGLVGAQLALAFLLVVGGGLLVRTMIGLSRVDPGLQPDRVLIFDLSGSIRFERSSEDERLRRGAVYKDVEARLQSVPGVESAGLSWLGLFGGSDLSIPIKYEGQTGRERFVHVDYVTGRYFETIGMRLVRGRLFSDEGRMDGRRMAVINEAMAQQRFGGTDVGREFVLDTPNDSGPPFVVAGVVADSKYNNVRETETKPMMWLPLAEVGGVTMRSIVLRMAPGAANQAIPAVRRALTAVDPELQVRRIDSLKDRIGRTQQRERLLLGLSIAFGLVALALSAFGVYGAFAQALAQRRRELGIRLVLGAGPGTLRRMLLTSASRLVLAAILVALPVVVAAGGALRSFLFDVTPADPTTLATGAMFVVITALVAADLPARRAAALDPVEVIRGE